jgi:hypothetical protein
LDNGYRSLTVFLKFRRGFIGKAYRVVQNRCVHLNVPLPLKVKVPLLTPDQYGGIIFRIGVICQHTACVTNKGGSGSTFGKPW